MFWNEPDPERKADERRAFLTDVSLIGGLIIAAVDTEGKPSLGWRGRRAAHKVSEAVTAALPVGAATGGALADSAIAEKVGHGLQVGAERGRGARARRPRTRRRTGRVPPASAPRELAEVARERAPELAETARERGAELADVARERGARNRRDGADARSKRAAAAGADLRSATRQTTRRQRRLSGRFALHHYAVRSDR